jgi:hypothetical protein
MTSSTSTSITDIDIDLLKKALRGVPRAQLEPDLVRLSASVRPLFEAVLAAATTRHARAKAFNQAVALLDPALAAAVRLGVLSGSVPASPNGTASAAGATVTGGASGTSTIGWPTPEPHQAPGPAPQLPLDLFAPTLQAFVKDVAHRMQSAPDFVLWTLLAVFSAVIGRGAWIRIKLWDDWAEPSTLWVGNIGDSGTLKTPSQNAAANTVLHTVARLLHEAFAIEHAQWQALATTDPHGAGPEPVERVCRTGNATTEKLRELCSDLSSRGLVLVRDELAGLIGELNKYHGGRGGDRQFYLQSYSGGPLPTDRISRKTLPVTNLLFSIVGGIQPKLARAIFSPEDDKEDGLAARFICPWPEQRAVQWVDESPNLDARTRIRAATEVLFKADWSTTLQTDDYGEPFCRPSPDGVAQYASWWADTKNLVRDNRARFDGGLGFRLNKYDGLLPRLILVNHLLEWALAPSPKRTRAAARTVDAELVTRMVTLMRVYMLPMDERVYQAYGMSDAASNGERVLEWLQRDVRAGNATRTSLTAREARRAVRPDSEEAAAIAVEWLCSRNWLREQVPPAQRRRGRQPSDVYDINPHALTAWNQAHP